MYKRSVIISALCISVTAAAQQSLRFKRIEMNDGLSQNTVTSIIQDKHGFMWFGTQDGLNRYDGYTFKIYRHSDDDTTSLSNNYIMNLTLDQRGNIWAGTTNGLNKIDGRSGKLSRISFGHLKPDAEHYRVVSLTEAADGLIYFTSSTKLYSIDSLDQVKEVSSNVILTDYVGYIFAAGDLLVMDAEYGICAYNIKKSESRYLYKKPGTQLLGVWDRYYYFEEKGSVFFCHMDSGDVHPFYDNLLNISSTKSCNSILKNGKEVWVSTQNGLLWGNGKDTLFIRSIPGYEFSLSSDFVYGVFKDNKGLYWIGTARGGLCLFDPKWMRFKPIGKPLGLDRASWNFVEKGDTLVIATGKGLKFYRKKNETARVSSYLLPEQVLYEIKVPKVQEALKNNLTTSVYADKKDNLWIGTENEGLYCYNLRTGLLKNLPHVANDTNSLSYKTVFHITGLSENTIGVATNNGYNFIDINTFRIRRFLMTQFYPEIKNNYIMKAVKDGENIWFCTAGGLLRYNTLTGKAKNFYPDKKHLSEQYHNIVSDFLIDSKKRHWVSTFGYGLLLLDPATSSFKKYGVKEGLKNETVLGLIEDDAGNLWLGTHDGIARFSPEKERFDMYDKSQGLDHNECTENGYYKSGNGDLHVGTMSGLVIFNPLHFVSDTSVYPAIISNLIINYKPVENSEDYISGNRFRPESIRLNYTDQVVTFEFASLDFLKSEGLSHKYRLEGFNDNWITVPSSGRYVTYTNLPPGTYTLHIVPVFNNLEQPEAALNLLVTMTPPFWKTWWFIGSVVLTSLAFIILIVRFYSQRRLRNRLRQIEEKQKFQREKERISRELHDNVGSQLTYIIKSLDNLSYKSGKENNSLHTNLDSLSDFSRETLNHLRESIWAINSKSIMLEELVGKLHDYLNKLKSSIERPEIRIETNCITNFELNPTAAINTFRIIQEAINNSLKHADSSLLSIGVFERENRIEFTVSDNGKGFKPGHKGNGHYGLKNMQLRADEMNAELSIAQNNGQGTLVKLLLKP